jgi:DNA repair protein RadC
MDGLLIRDMPVVERPRQRLQKLGVEALREEELLALVFGTGYKGHSALDVARTVLARYPLNRLLSLTPLELQRIKGVGESRAARLLAGQELCRRLRQEDTAPTLRSVNDVVSQALELRDKKKEHLMAFFLNARHQLLAKEIISIGTLTASLAHPREIFFPAIGKAAAGVILVHNHPSGNPAPSEEDIRLTRRVSQAGQILGIDLLDHLIIAAEGCYSFKTSGAL